MVHSRQRQRRFWSIASLSLPPSKNQLSNLQWWSIQAGHVSLLTGSGGVHASGVYALMCALGVQIGRLGGRIQVVMIVDVRARARVGCRAGLL